MNIDQNTKELLNETQKLIDLNNDLEASLKKLQQIQEKIAPSTDKLSKAYRDNAIELKKAENAFKGNTEQIEKNAKILDLLKGNIEKTNNQFDSFETKINSVVRSQKDHNNSLDQLKTGLTSLGETVEKQDKTTEKSTKNFDFLGKSFDAVHTSIDNLKDSAGEFGPQLGAVSTGFNVLESGIDVVKTGFTGIGAAIKATGFGLLLLAIEAVSEYFQNDKIGIKRFQGSLAAIGVVVDKVKLVVQKLRGAIIDALIHPVDNIKLFWDGLVNKFSKTFSALGEIITGVFTLSPAKIGHGVKQLGNEVNKATATIKNGFKQLKKEVVDTITEAGEAYDKAYNNAGKAKNKTNSSNTKNPKLQLRPATEELTLTSIGITQTFELQKKAYDDELALLDGQLAKKLISQAQYNTQSQALQDKYHQHIITVNEAFVKNDMDATVKHLRDIAEAEGKLAYDETNVKKAILPGQKLDAEKQLITDKYNYEIVLANGNAEKIKELEIKKQEALTSVTQQYEQQRKEFALNTAQQVADKAFSIISNNIKSSSDAKIKGLEKDKAGELSNKNLTQTQRKAIEDKYQKKEAQEKTKAFKAEQRMSVLQAVVNGALAVTKATAQTGVLAPFVIPGIIASTALQIATIVAQKPPAFAKGGRFVSDGRGALLPGYSRTDNTNAYLRSGEAVVVSEAMRNPWARNLVSAINVAHGGRDFSMPNTGRGYAIGGIFTDGGNANRYYSQPVNDVKELANTMAYQMINNFPPIYVDVKDVNNQQNILAQTVNRVNL